VEKVSCFKFLCVFIKDDLTWSRQADSAVKTAQKCLYFLRRLKKFGMSTKTLTNFYRCTIESICITARLDSCSTAERKAFQTVVKTGTTATQAMDCSCCCRRRYRNIQARTTKPFVFSNSNINLIDHIDHFKCTLITLIILTLLNYLE